LSQRDNKLNFKDESGDIAENMLKERGHIIISRKIVDDEVHMIRLEVLKSVVEDKAELIILMGGTGVSPRDVTIEAISPLFTKELVGFGDVFRNSSYKEIGSSAFMTRVTAGTIGTSIVFALPGSPDAVKKGLNLILPEVGHLVLISSGG
jgi:molybdenum cofactor biosynthesis protein B